VYIFLGLSCFISVGSAGTGTVWIGMPYQCFFTLLETMPPLLVWWIPCWYAKWPVRATTHASAET